MSYLKPHFGSFFEAELLAISSLYLLQHLAHLLPSTRYSGVLVDGISDRTNRKIINGTMWNAHLRQSSCHLTLLDLCS